jgi:formylglycine-generating enzyme required for sulfatase activity
VPGGAFERLNDSSLPADVSPFDLERFEVTVGRLREFVDAYPSSRPSVGAGAHPFTPGSGWDAAWDANLPATRSDLVEGLRSCQRNLDIDISTYTEKPGVNDSRPVNCVTWYEAFAFCAWTGGRLPTFAEHQFAYVGGSAQRYFPWSVPPSDTTIDFSRANFLEQSCPSDTTDESSCVAPVGSSPAGAGAFGQEDLAGNLSEFTLDPSALPLSSSCNDCIETSATSTSRRISGGSWLDDAYELQGDYGYGGALPTDRSSTIGFRCVQP